MGYWSLTEEQEQALIPHIKDQVVFDMGAGDLSLSHKLIEFGAKRVFSIDTKITGAVQDPRIIPCTGTFMELYELTIKNPDFVFVGSWLINRRTSAVLYMLQATKIVLLANQFDGTACGHIREYRLTSKLELFEYIPDRANCLLIVGNQFKKRPITILEKAGMDDHRMYMYADHPSIRNPFRVSVPLEYEEIEEDGD